MKRVLLGTTALVAAGVIGASQAEAAFDVKVNGNYYWAYGIVDQDDDTGDPGNGFQNQALNNDSEVHFRISQTLDNGITVGGRTELEGFPSGDQIDEAWIFFRGGFGELRVGDEDDARKLKSYTAPSASFFLFNVNSPFFTFQVPATSAAVVVSSNSTTPNLENDSAKLIYFTPSFGGFQLAVSYAPDGSQNRTSFGTGTTTGGAPGGPLSNAISIGADWSGEFNGVTIGAGGGYSRGSVEFPGAPDDDPYIWAAGINIGFAGFTVGGSIAVGDELTVSGFNGYSVSEATVFDVGATYTVDAVSVGVGWSHGEYEAVATGADNEVDFVNFELGYALGEGVVLGAFIGYFDFESDGSTSLDFLENSGWQAGVGAGLDF